LIDDLRTIYDDMVGSLEISMVFDQKNPATHPLIKNPGHSGFGGAQNAQAAQQTGGLAYCGVAYLAAATGSWA
jgi:hypothetical protein